jgi:hypothetical protein
MAKGKSKSGKNSGQVKNLGNKTTGTSFPGKGTLLVGSKKGTGGVPKARRTSNRFGGKRSGGKRR